MRLRVRLLVAVLLAPCAAWSQDNPVGPEFQINTFTTERQEWPSVAADSSGKFVVVWQSLNQDGSSYGVYGQRYDSTGTPLGTEFRVNTYTTDRQFHPSVTADSSGNFVVVWESAGQDGSEYGVFGQRYASSGAPLGPEFRVSTYTSGSQEYPVVAADSAGSFVVVWHSQPGDSNSRDVFGQRYDASGAPLGSEFRVNTYTTYAQQWPSLAADPSGNFVVLWTGGGPPSANFGLFGQRYSSSGSPLGPEFRVNDTGLSGAKFRAAKTPGEGGSLQDLAFDPAGNFVIVFTGDDGSYSPGSPGVFAKRYSSSGAPLGPEFRVNMYTPYVQWNPAVSTDASGNFVVVWEDTFLDDGSVWGQLFASSGSPIGPMFPVNSYTTAMQLGPTVAADPSGHFVVVWESYAQDGSHNGVFGQRFDSMTVPVELMHVRVE